MLSNARRFLLASSLLLLALLGTFADTSEPKSTPKQITQWVEQLGDNDFKVRENATKKLWQAGAAAESALQKAAQSDDREVARRARELLDKFRWGIYPDTPADIVALIHAYQSSAGKPRMDVLQKLLDSGDAGLRAVLKIAAAEKDVNQRRMLADAVAKKLPTAFLLAVTEGKFQPFERLLEFGHEGKFIGHNQYVAYWLLRGKLAERITHFADRLREHPEDKWLVQASAYLHRANGDLIEARKAAEKSDRADLLQGILYEMGDWKALAELPNNASTQKPADKGISHIASIENPVEKWAYRATFVRLAGKSKEFESAVSQLRKCVESASKRDRAERAWVAAKGLLLNDRPAEGLELLKTVPEHREALFDLLCVRLDFDAAMDLAAKKVPTDKEISRLDLAHARQLYLLGEKEGEALFDQFAERIKDEVDPYWVQSLLKEELRAGLKDVAFSHAAKALSVKSSKNCVKSVREQLYLAKLFPQQSTTAEVWWTVLERKFMDESPAAVLKRLRDLLEGKVAAKDVKAWIEQVEQWGPPAVISPAQADAWWLALADAAIGAGLEDLAIALLEKKADSRDALLRLGDLLAAKKQWDKAGERYRQAWTKQHRGSSAGGPADPLSLYLAGEALIHAGQEKEGKKLIEQAHWVPFANSRVRFNFLTALAKRGHKEAAQRETELLLRVSEPNTFYANNAIRLLAFTARTRKDYFKAAEGLEQSMLSCLKSHINFVEYPAYANSPAQIHKLRATALLAAGKLDEALKQADLALTDAPGYANLPIALVPELERRGHKKEAADLFNRCYRAYEKACRAYPRCAFAHNSMAWMSACCRRNLDQALQHAEKAVELAPNHAGYLDTLAEIHFQRGKKDKAIALQRRAVELNPKKSYYRKQLKRLEAGDPSAELPPENDE